MIRTTCSVLVCTLFVNSLYAQSASEVRQLEGYTYKHVTLGAPLDAPGIPVVIGLHWSGSTPDEFEPYLKNIAGPVRIILVQGSYAHKSGYSFYVTTPVRYYDMNDDEKMLQMLAEGTKLATFILGVTKTYKPIHRPILIGASQGGDLSYFIAIRYPEIISQACPLLGTIDNRMIGPVPRDAALAPIDVFHGTADPIVNLGTSQAHLKLLQQNGYPASHHIYDGIGHDIPDSMKNDYTSLINTLLANWREKGKK